LLIAFSAVTVSASVGNSSSASTTTSCIWTSRTRRSPLWKIVAMVAGAQVNHCSDKQCSKCGEVKSTSLFYRNAAKKDGLSTACKVCDKAKAAAHYNADPEHRWRIEIKRKYGLTAIQYYMMLDQQDGKCKICKGIGPGGAGRTSRMAIDHCHQTGKVRGILCNRCNRALGLFEDNISNLTAAIEYLSR